VDTWTAWGPWAEIALLEEKEMLVISTNHNGFVWLKKKTPKIVDFPNLL
jgi:hypothetical protein